MLFYRLFTSALMATVVISGLMMGGLLFFNNKQPHLNFIITHNNNPIKMSESPSHVSTSLGGTS
jgi:hypothetical protein